ncbi:MAG: 4Fe-4S ferredoxin [Chloroflexi bacterium B3_Chlor]|nr:MAG: 4Fe-4S ferredoxin [Chloroflexi bacterium B3_Chlor]
MGKTKVSDISRAGDEQLLELTSLDWMTLPCPSDQPLSIRPLPDEQRSQIEHSLDGISALGIPKPTSKGEEDGLVQSFLNGLRKLLSHDDNWTFWQPLVYSLESCVKCQTCSDACPIYLSSGKQEIYRPTYRGEVLRRIINKYIKKGGRISSKLKGEEIDLNWPTVARLAELAYRCTLCRRCAQWCPLGVDNALISREIRKLFSQELGIAPKELHDFGTIQQLSKGSSTGMTPVAFRDSIEFMEEEIEEITGRRIEIPIDKEGADILLLHNAGEFLSWPDNTEAFAIIFDALGISWTLSSDLAGYDSVNYGVWYDDVQLARIVLTHAEVANKLKVQKILIGECGHAHKTLLVIADRILTGELNIPRESALPLLEDAVCNGRIKLDPSRNDFPVTLHDPCNLVRLTGIVEPQRRIVRKICPQFREMEPHGVENYCCGGGSGFAIMSSRNFPDWKMTVSGRMKFKQVLDAFQDVGDPEAERYVCAPCSNCKGQLRDLLSYYQAREKHSVFYGGLAELIVNAMVDLEQPFIQWEWH